MTLFDTHCHLHFKDFDSDRSEAVERAKASGVRYFLCVGTDPETNDQAALMAEAFPGAAFFSYGLHPHHAHQADESWFQGMDQLIRQRRPAAIGEIGLDFYKSEGEPSVQKTVFRRMLRLAKSFDLPVIVHSRNAWEDTWRILYEEREGLRGVLHCFSYDAEAMKKASDLGFFISFAGNISYRSAASLLAVAKITPPDRLVLETDAPYLPPHGFRGQRNEPARVAALCEFLAAERGVSASQLAEQSTLNAAKLFGMTISGD